MGIDMPAALAAASAHAGSAASKLLAATGPAERVETAQAGERRWAHLAAAACTRDWATLREALPPRLLEEEGGGA
eukprot:CAMPEP_0115548724 /NCGR_PEP_ID=MMETSP0271-20121206/94318_1 /TAXON_ID=71861 /ORGANISM="Scrippsiella trochoidea, Strain CCMP3099" /LENGTH=74 /DNA_ID=CAMNT_0002982213 /DNA_START=48 /DNA_END=269 /DNA_ORIENTATION=-